MGLAHAVRVMGVFCHVACTMQKGGGHAGLLGRTGVEGLVEEKQG